MAMKEHLDSLPLEEKVMQQAFLHSCLQTPKQPTFEIFTEELPPSSEWKRGPECLFPVNGDDSGDDEELDFSKDIGLYGKRTPAVFVGRDSYTGEARYSMPSPTRADAPAALAAPASCGSFYGPQKADGSFYLRRTGAVASAKQTKQVASQLPRSNSSYIVQPAALRVCTLQRSNSSYVYSPTKPVARSRSAPAGPRPLEKRHSNVPAGPLVQELRLDSVGLPNPSMKPLREKVCAALGVTSSARIETMQGFVGGQNQGMWVLQDKQRTLILKLVEGKRKHHAMPTEAEQFVKLARQHPAIRSDPALAFPIKVLSCLSASGTKHDLIVMQKAPGRSFAETIAQKWHERQVQQLMQVFEALGQFLASIHDQYNMQHGDLQPSNIFYDDNTGYFTLIDIGGMDSGASSIDSDIQHFGESLRMFARGLQAHDLFEGGARNFAAGYAAVKAA